MRIHPYAEIFPALDGEPLHNLIADIKAHGLREAIWLHQDGSILDGRNRYVACTQLAITPTYRTCKEKDTLAFVLSMNLARRHLNESQRAMVAARIATLKHGGDRKSDQAANLQIAPTQKAVSNTLNISERTISDARKVQQHATKEIIASVDRGDMAVSVAAKLADKPKEFQQQVMKNVEINLMAGKTVNDTLKSMNVHVGKNTGENEWYTPPEFIEAARNVMGSIDLDPASSEIANKTVKAKRFYTIDDDGLKQIWKGNIWLNPPYSQPLISEFSTYITKVFSDGDINQAIILVNNATETQWFQAMLHCASAICLPEGRIKFFDIHGKASGSPLQGQAILYMGNRLEQFCNEFSPFGRVMIHAKF